MIRHAFVSMLLAIVVVVACSAPSAPAAGEEKKDAAKTPFAIEVTQVEAVKAGERGTVRVVFTPAKGYKWNEGFPSSFAVDSDSKVAAFDKKELAKADFEASEKKASVKLPFQGRAAGEEVVKAKASFSVCNDETCLIFRDEAVEMKVAVK